MSWWCITIFGLFYVVADVVVIVYPFHYNVFFYYYQKLPLLEKQNVIVVRVYCGTFENASLSIVQKFYSSCSFLTLKHVNFTERIEISVKNLCYSDPADDPGPPSPKMVLVVAYLRTGSTFTASLFTQQPDTFYVFEPLHMLYDKASKGKKISFLDGTVRYVFLQFNCYLNFKRIQFRFF